MHSLRTLALGQDTATVTAPLLSRTQPGAWVRTGELVAPLSSANGSVRVGKMPFPPHPSTSEANGGPDTTPHQLNHLGEWALSLVQ